MVVRRRASGRYLGPEGRTLMHGIGAFIKETPEKSLSLHQVRIQPQFCDLDESPHSTRLAPWSQLSSLPNCEKEVAVDYELPSLWCFLTAS